jgi:putative peptidoglycan lipid II flippase
MSVVLVGAVFLLEALLAGAHFFVLPDWQEIISLSMWMAPGLFFVCLYALNASLLQCQKKYFLPALAPVFFNLVWILAAFWVKDLPRKEAMFWLSVATTGAFGAQLMATAFVKKGLGWNEWLRPQLFSLEWRALLKPLLLGIIGISAVQFNSLLDAIFARIADPEGPAFLWYAIRIQQLPLALFGIALSGALLPPLARAVKAGDMARYKEMLERGLKQASVFMLICTFGIFALGEVGINLLYGRGDFSAMDVRETFSCLWGYGAGLIPSVFVLLLAAGFYAQKSYSVPMRASFFSVLANILLNAIFVFGFQWGAVSIAIATSISAALNAVMLARSLQVSVFTAPFWIFFGKVGLCSGAAAFVTMAVSSIWIGEELARDFTSQLVELVGLGSIFVGTLGAIAYPMGLLGWMRRKAAQDF